MTVKELKEELNNYPDDYPVIIERMDGFGYPDDAEDITGLEHVDQFFQDCVMIKTNGYVE